ncbi:MAG: L,D-transpeptidase [Nitrospira sp.]|nr:L,D-transpeptidase [Nitrospira sp.]
MRPDFHARAAGRASIIRDGWFTIILALAVLLPVVSYAETPKKLRGLCAVLHPSDERIDWECRTLRGGESLERLFGEWWREVARFNRVDRRHAGPGVSIKVPKRVEDLAEFEPLPLVYQPAEGDEKFILIDLAEQFLGAYEYGALRFSLPLTSGPRAEPDRTPTGEFRISAAHRRRRSSLYTVEGTDRPYPMNHALRFHINRAGVSYWIHGRDLPGYPASHGCVGLYDEPMQREQYGVPRDPELNDAKRLFEWVLGGSAQDDRLIPLSQGPRVHIIGRPPKR